MKDSELTFYVLLMLASMLMLLVVVFTVRDMSVETCHDDDHESSVCWEDD